MKEPEKLDGCSGTGQGSKEVMLASEGRLHKSLDTAGGILPDLFLWTYANDPRSWIVCGIRKANV